MSLKERTSVLRALWRELISWGRIGRTPEPLAVMSEEERVQAYALAACGQEVMAPIYLFHGAQTADLIRPGDTVLDLGCGPASQLAVLARLHPSANFIGVDLSEGMLSQARRHVASLGLDNVRFQLGDMTDLSFLSDQSVDVVFSSMALHHLPEVADLQRALSEVARVVRADGGVYLADLSRLRSAAAIDLLAHQYAHRQPEEFTKDYFDSLHAAFSHEEMRESLGPLGRLARLHCMWPGRFMMAIKSSGRCSPSPQVQQALFELDEEMPEHHRGDYFFIRQMFRLGGLVSPNTKAPRARGRRRLAARPSLLLGEGRRR